MDAGYLILLFALIYAIFSIIGFISGNRRKSERDIKYAKWSIAATCLLLTASAITMFFYLFTHDFRVAYVAMHTDRNLSLVYTVSAFWAGSAGSLLLWAWFLSLFNLGVMLKEKNDTTTHYALAILQSIQVFFIFTLISVSNPFERLDFTPLDGVGLNPLLKDPGMVVHPPTLFIGYAGLLIPFAYALSGILLNDERWILRVRKWTLSSWLFLSLGIFLGGWWSYTVLGWGGYWAWDAVENASLLPWLTSTAFLHSVMIQQVKRGMRLWNILLCVLTFEFIMFGTFVTRSGIISSVHAFGLSALGPYFIAYMLVMLLFSLGVMFTRYGQLRSRNIFESVASKETTFLLNNLIFVMSAFTIWWGVIYPLVHETIQGVKISVGPGFYNQTQAPLYLLLIILMGFCVVIPWRRASPGELTRKLRYPMAVTIASVTVTAALGLINVYTLIGSASLVFASTSMVQEYVLDYGFIRREERSNLLKSFIRPISKRRRRYGGYIVHIAVIVICFGIIGTMLHAETYSLTLQRGQSATISGYTFSLQDNDFRMEEEKRVWTIQLGIQQEGRYLGTATPAVEQYLRDEQFLGKVDILGTTLQDIYVILEGIDQEGTADINVKFMPLVGFIWAGGIILTVGVIIALFPRRRGVK
ncbi:MAG: heme lyase CcmF/NrfE family subunit [Nitrososphaeria archaeon]|nr:heme lyase CcmF/NrfE family subunit [Nitrososphaeria archaeon]NIQ33285.1 heme lyase CcmF/NrfE family subunit [Nitrososphaeria archaeon]